jgi:spore coat polysaccharide biosynthesis protein SpsF
MNIAEDSLITHDCFHWNIGIFIAVRSESTRLPDKAFATICGKYAVEWLIERVKQSAFARQIVLCTTTRPDDDRFQAVCEKHGISIFRGSNEDVMERFLCAARQFKVDIIVRVTGDDVLSDPGYIDRAVRQHLRVNAEYTGVIGLPYGLGREVISTWVLEWIHGHIRETDLTEYMTWFLDQPAYVRTSYVQADPNHSRPEYRLTLDTPEDLEAFRWIFSRMAATGKDTFGLDDVIALLDSEPGRALANAQGSTGPARGDIDTRLDLQLMKAGRRV